MNPDKYRKRFQGRRGDNRLRRQIATEAAKRILATLGPPDAQGRLPEAEESAYYAAKRKAAAVLGQTVRAGDLPSDSEVREQVLVLWREGVTEPLPEDLGPEPEEGDPVQMSEHLDRFEIYRMRLLPLEEVKQDPHNHPEGDALYHSLQVFDRARDARPYDEEFLLAALLHDVGKAIEPRAHIGAALESLKGTLTDRAAWLIEHHHDLSPRGGRTLSTRDRQALEQSPYYEDLLLLRELDLAGTEIGVPVPSVDEALEFIRGIESESYLEEPGDTEPPE